MNMQVVSIVISLVVLVMFIIMFVFVIRIWNFHQEILRSGGYPTLMYSRAKRDATSILEGRVPWDFEKDEIIQILSRYPDNPEAVDLVQRLVARESEVGNNRSEIPD
ncbi:MAG: hypothetical protein A2158_02410 [Chloroflexi bacterium RBG_13_46_14]|nr:MAG: hypothetical protein A2158_02410 [Chloroflexi bacterium RBG_13_46_14]